MEYGITPTSSEEDKIKVIHDLAKRMFDTEGYCNAHFTSTSKVEDQIAELTELVADLMIRVDTIETLATVESSEKANDVHSN